MACYVIHMMPNLSPAEYRRAARLGPPHVSSRRGPEELLRAAGFSEIARVDVTETFRATCESWVAVRARYADRLRAAEGEVEFAEEEGKKRGLLAGIEEGLLCRTFVVGTKAANRVPWTRRG